MRELNCADAGYDCEGVIRAESDDEVMSQAAQHLNEAHGVSEVDVETDQRLRSLIHEA